MFEKEAEEYSRNFDWTNDDRIIDYSERGFQKGAEFGYNKAKEDADKMKSRFLELCNLKDMRIAELEKANEWHYVKDGDLPKEFDKPYLCKVYSHFEVGYFMAYKEQPWHFDEYYLDNEDVIAWKEIVLPELPKESEKC